MTRPSNDAPAPTPSGAQAPRDDASRSVRDDFAFPALDHAQIDVLKRRAQKLGVTARKNALLRAGIAALAALPEAELIAALPAGEASATDDKRKEP